MPGIYESLIIAVSVIIMVYIVVRVLLAGKKKE